MSIPPVVSIYGNSDSGKTELVTELVEDFSGASMKVCTIKHSPGDISLDQEGKDTWRHKSAGARLTVFASDVETSFLTPEKMELEEILEKIAEISSPDLVIAEGYKDEDVPKIAVGDIDTRDNTLEKFTGDKEALKRKIRELIELSRIEEDLTGLDCGRCGFQDCRELAEAIYRGEKEVSDCEVLEQRRVDLRVNGKEVPLEYFPARFVEGGLKGMLKALKGVDDEINRISLEIKD